MGVFSGPTLVPGVFSIQPYFNPMEHGIKKFEILKGKTSLFFFKCNNKVTTSFNSIHYHSMAVAQLRATNYHKINYFD